MSAYYRTKGFIFKKTDINESDRIFSVFTEDFGRIEITGKALRKITSKLRAGIDIFYLSEIEFIQGKNRKTLTSAVKIKKFIELDKDSKKIETACYVSEIMDSFIKGEEKDRDFFIFLEEFLNNAFFKKRILNQQLVFQYFFWNFLSAQGYHLQVHNCAVCQGKLNPDNIYFSGKEGGIICKNCARDLKEAERINSDIAKILRLVLNKDWHTISRLKIGAASQNLLESIFENAIHAFSPAHS